MGSPAHIFNKFQSKPIIGWERLVLTNWLNNNISPDVPESQPYNEVQPYFTVTSRLRSLYQTITTEKQTLYLSYIYPPMTRPDTSALLLDCKAKHQPATTLSTIVKVHNTDKLCNPNPEQPCLDTDKKVAPPWVASPRKHPPGCYPRLATQYYLL